MKNNGDLESDNRERVCVTKFLYYHKRSRSVSSACPGHTAYTLFFPHNHICFSVFIWFHLLVEFNLRRSLRSGMKSVWQWCFLQITVITCLDVSPHFMVVLRLLTVGLRKGYVFICLCLYFISLSRQDKSESLTVDKIKFQYLLSDCGIKFFLSYMLLVCKIITVTRTNVK